MICNGINCAECEIKDLCDDLDIAIENDYDCHSLLADIYNRGVKDFFNIIKNNMPIDICSGGEAVDEIQFMYDCFIK